MNFCKKANKTEKTMTISDFGHSQLENLEPGLYSCRFEPKGPCKLMRVFEDEREGRKAQVYGTDDWLSPFSTSLLARMQWILKDLDRIDDCTNFLTEQISASANSLRDQVELVLKADELAREKAEKEKIAQQKIASLFEAKVIIDRIPSMVKVARLQDETQVVVLSVEQGSGQLDQPEIVSAFESPFVNGVAKPEKLRGTAAVVFDVCKAAQMEPVLTPHGDRAGFSIVFNITPFRPIPDMVTPDYS